ncbi:transposase [Lentzea sp. NBRC 105346]|uniref:RNA-guided endonuclease InsQ/TnpB family protein n=1 Tax=Lentzea sp. NBRC 105346 TaxID=3032205 RepID=UPI0024A5E712|nr:transposase [Lentzea sp. NBRC 105346]GLZ33504.1 transposase [Lentzea sp. NBRC 105346]
MSHRYRLVLAPGQEAGLLEHCRHARFVWNLAVEQHQYWRPGRAAAPGLAEQCRQLTDARAAFNWLASGSVTVQQQALRDFHQAMRRFYTGTSRRPGWRKMGTHEGFRQVGLRADHVRRLNRGNGRVWVPKIGWVRFRWSRAVPANVKSYRVTRDVAGRWHIVFASRPEPILAPGNGQTVGVDRGVVVSAALSTGDLLYCPATPTNARRRLVRLQRKLARGCLRSNRRRRVKVAVAKMHARTRDRRRDWVEKTSTDLARRFDVIRVENLTVANMTRSAKGTAAEPGHRVRQKAGLNRAILAAGWGHLVSRLEHKAPGRVEKINPAYTSQQCSRCGHVAAESRESQAVFRCRSCGFECNADVNAARNIAAGRAVNARGGDRVAGPVSREPQLVTSAT